MLPPNKAAPVPLHPFDNSVAQKIKLFSSVCMWSLVGIWALQPHLSHRKSPGALVLLGSHCWAKEIVCGQQPHSKPWQVVIAISNPRSQRRISSLLFIVTAGASSHSLLWLLLFFKATGSCYCLILVEFLQFVLSVATLLKAPETLYLSSKCQLPLGPSCSGKWNFPVQTSPSLLILDLAANWPVNLHSA